MSLVIPEQEIIAIASGYRFGKDRDFPAAARGIDNIGRHRIPGRVASKSLDNLDSLAHGCPEMGRTHNWVTLIEIVGLDPDLKEPVH